MQASRAVTTAAAVLAAAILLRHEPARACGGLFCNSSSPVNQAAERILFVDHGDGRQTAVIEIKYEGPPSAFSWVLPVPGEPDVGISSTAAFDRLQNATNPLFMRNTTFEEGCPQTVGRGGLQAPQAGSATGGFDNSGPQPPAVMVLDEGSVGPFNYQTIGLRPDLPNAADAAIMWLMDNGYDVSALAPDVLGPYLANGLNLICFRLDSQSDSGSIRPIKITYDATLPFIPIRPTAVAANENMGILVWVVSEGRSVPDNYRALEINEALIDWFNPMSTYNDVVTKAANEAQGKGFVTELAAPSDTLDGVVLADSEASEWMRISSQSYASPIDLFNDALSQFNGWDGFPDVLDQSVTLPQDVSESDFLGCPNCYANVVTIDQAAMLRALYERVYKPVADTQDLLGSRPYVTRLYTTMSADEMDTDPAFNFNQDLRDVSNIHMAEQLIGCDGTWHMTLPQGDVVYGTEPGVWPMEAMAGQPAARLVLQLDTEGEGDVVEDNSEQIAQLLREYAIEQGDTVALDPEDRPQVTGAASDDGCRVGASAARAGLPSQLGLWTLALGLLARRRRA